MMKLVFLVVAAVAAVASAVEEPPVTLANSPVITTQSGQIQGEVLSSGLFSDYFSFKGIPYAQAPVGQLRFRAPRPHGGWTGIRDGTQHGPSCPSGSWLSPTVDEDCLFLNIYSPNLIGRRAVMVWIHGGSFSGGNGDAWVYGPDHLVNEDVLVVTLNYRLGALGFLSTEDSASPGNYGMKDMVMALRWIRNNIAAFGGDPDNVTIFGESAGGAAVHYLVLSPTATGLFNRAISQSGSALNPWAFQTAPRTAAFQLARDLGITATTSEQLMTALRNVPAMDIVGATPGSMAMVIPRGLRAIPFVPSVDPAGTSAEERFLPQRPIDIMQAGTFNRVEYISGYTNAESLVMIRELLLDPSVFPTMNANEELLIPFGWNVRPGSPEAREIVTEIRNFYFSGRVLADDIRWEWTNYLTDQMFAHGIDRTVRIHSERQSQSVYYYTFSFDGDLNLIKTLFFLNSYPGAVHADDIFYLFSVTSIPPPLFPTNASLTTRRRMVRMWSNFAKFGNPTQNRDALVGVSWTRVMGTQEFMDIGTALTPGRRAFEDRMAFWNRLSTRFARYMP